MVKLSTMGYAISGAGLSMFMGFLSVASPVSHFVFWLIGMVCVVCAALGLLNFGGLVNKGYSFNQKTLLIGIMPGLVFMAIFLVLVSAGMALGVR
jgi:hypothetical protein